MGVVSAVAPGFSPAGAALKGGATSTNITDALHSNEVLTIPFCGLLVTITAHDSIDGCLDLLKRLGDLPDFIMGEEVSAYRPQFQHHIHLGVYGHREAQHREIQSLRANGEELVAYLRQQDLLFGLNIFFHAFAGGQHLHREPGP